MPMKKALRTNARRVRHDADAEARAATSSSREARSAGPARLLEDQDDDDRDQRTRRARPRRSSWSSAPRHPGEAVREPGSGSAATTLTMFRTAKVPEAGRRPPSRISGSGMTAGHRAATPPPTSVAYERAAVRVLEPFGSCSSAASALRGSRRSRPCTRRSPRSRYGRMRRRRSCRRRCRGRPRRAG